MCTAFNFKAECEIISNLKDIFIIYGVPVTIQHDQGPEFTSKVYIFIVQDSSYPIEVKNFTVNSFYQEFQSFVRALNIDNRSTAPYHPQSNGLVEAHNKILKK